ncbi:Heme-binding-like protein [Porphyridium purpureum]|uniref:Heme-binding-like protein n=1 Tax=Porphyridium purpureum TaxID=35688 RepID=A0A5J4YSY3_PORPP|nr:Heme-binding-like protein [Porphyridium purpureum]|eukprot:POR5542..scf227_4
MGIVFGRVSVEQPAHEVLQKFGGFEIRKYPKQVAASTDMSWDRSDDSGGAFQRLARYIGVFGTPENQARATGSASDTQEPVAMTAPVVMNPPTEQAAESVAMTAPVVMNPPKEQGAEAVAMTAPVVMEGASTTSPDGQSKGKGEMTFLLPAKYTLETAPVPTDPRVRIHEVPERTLAVKTFSGSFAKDVQESMAQQLKEELDAAKIKITGAWGGQGYNPPFTLPFLRTNEVFFPVEFSV